jgi:hypothetical protein
MGASLATICARLERAAACLADGPGVPFSGAFKMLILKESTRL